MISNRELRKFLFEPLSWKCARSWLDSNPGWFEHLRAMPVEEGGLNVHYLALEFDSVNPLVPEPLRVIVEPGGIVAATWFLRDGLRPWNLDWVFLPPSHPMAEAQEPRLIENIGMSLDAFFREEWVAYVALDEGGGHFGVLPAAQIRSREYRRGRVSTIVRSWKGTFDDELGPWDGFADEPGATAASVFIYGKP
jgi:hypothetical protein